MNFLEALDVARKHNLIASNRILARNKIGYIVQNSGTVCKRSCGYFDEEKGILLHITHLLDEEWFLVDDNYVEIDIKKTLDIERRIEILEEKMDAIKVFVSKVFGE